MTGSVNAVITTSTYQHSVDRIIGRKYPFFFRHRLSLKIKHSQYNNFVNITPIGFFVNQNRDSSEDYFAKTRKWVTIFGYQTMYRNTYYFQTTVPKSIAFDFLNVVREFNIVDRGSLKSGFSDLFQTGRKFYFS